MQVVICIVSRMRYTYCYILKLDHLHGTNSISGGTLSMAAAVIGAAALMIYSKWAGLGEKNRWQEEGRRQRRQHDEVGTTRRKADRKSKEGATLELSHSKKRTPRRLAFLDQSGLCPLDIFPIETKFRTFWGLTQAARGPTACHRVWCS